MGSDIALVNVRYIAAQEACWRIFEFETNSKSHSICHLPVHLPDKQSVIFEQGSDMQAVLDRGAKTMLTEFFVANKKIRAAIANGNPNNDRLCT